jgi:hypothetical protein
MVGALSETVKEGFLYDPPNSSELYKKEFVDIVVGLLTDENLRTEYAMKCRDTILKGHHDWSDIAGEWNTLFTQIFMEKAQNPLPPYFIEIADAKGTVPR